MFHVAVLSILLLLKFSTSNKHEFTREIKEVDDSKELQMIESGIFPPTPDSMGIVFYVNLFNNSPRNMEVAAWMWRCCEELYDIKLCAHMKLVGGYGGIIASTTAKNVTLIYPNPYVFNRVGECEIIVGGKSDDNETKEEKVLIKFNTTLTSNQLYPATASKTCNHIDEDPLNECTPVDCSRKYSGYMLFYSQRNNRCQLPPRSMDFVTRDGDESSVSEVANETIKKVYVPESNLYEELMPQTNVNELAVNNIRLMDTSNEFSYIRCHHGNKSDYTGRCSCYPDWTSVNNYVRPTTLFVHFCSISTNIKYIRAGHSYPSKKFGDIALNCFNVDSIIKLLVLYCGFMLMSMTLSMMYITLYRYHVAGKSGEVQQTTVLNTYIADKKFPPAYSISTSESFFNKSSLSFILLEKNLKKLFGARLIIDKTKKTTPDKYELTRLIANEKVIPPNLKISQEKTKMKNKKMKSKTRKRNKFLSSSTNVIEMWKKKQAKSWRQLLSRKSLKNKSTLAKKSSEQKLPLWDSFSTEEDE